MIFCENWNKQKRYLHMRVSIYPHTAESASTHRRLVEADGGGRVWNDASGNQVGRRDPFSPFVYPHVLSELFFSLSYVDASSKLNKIEQNSSLIVIHILQMRKLEFLLMYKVKWDLHPEPLLYFTFRHENCRSLILKSVRAIHEGIRVFR